MDSAGGVPKRFVVFELHDVGGLHTTKEFRAVVAYWASRTGTSKGPAVARAFPKFSLWHVGIPSQENGVNDAETTGGGKIPKFRAVAQGTRARTKSPRTHARRPFSRGGCGRSIRGTLGGATQGAYIGLRHWLSWEASGSRGWWLIIGAFGHSVVVGESGFGAEVGPPPTAAEGQPQKRCA